MIEELESKYIEEYPFLKYINEDKSHYTHAKDAGYNDPDDLFLVGESGGFLLNIDPNDKFVDTYKFHEMADFYKKNHCYTFYREDSVPHRQLRKREEYRRRHGFSAPCLLHNGKKVDIRITGSMYNYLNYTLMNRLDDSSTSTTGKSATGRKEYSFPSFIDAQFWTFHIMEFAVRNGFHLIIDKTRRGGFSYIMAADSANDLNLNPKKVDIHVAFDNKYLTKKGGLTDFTINNLLFYEQNTYFKRGILSMDKTNFVLGYKLPNGQVAPNCWNSGLFSVSAHNDADCAIGKDALKVKVEEVSTMDNFDDFMNVTKPAMTTGDYVTGNLFCWGTATSGNMQTFNSNFYSPRRFGFMPFENVWDKDSRQESCGYFKPYAWGLQGEIDGQKAMDEDGNSNLELGLKIAFKNRERERHAAKTFSDYINYLGQYANMPVESFNSTSENIFSSEELMRWEERLRNDNAFNFYVDGWLVEKDGNVEFKTNERIYKEGGKLNHDFWQWIEGVPRKDREDPHGCIRKWFNPMKIVYTDENGVVRNGIPKGLYSISYDPVGVNKDKNEITLQHSHNSIKVWMNPTRYNNFKTALVCAYYGRPEKLIDADRICYNLARYYNCIGTTGVEVNRGETVSNFSKWKALKYLMRDPVQIWDNSIKGAVVSSYGVNMGGAANGVNGGKKLEGLRLLKEMLYSVVGKDELGNDIYFFQTIYDYQSIVELKQWNSVGNFDRVSEMIIHALQWKLTDIEAAKELARRKQLINKTDNILTRDWF